jgi:hypothetical protein
MFDVRHMVRLNKREGLWGILNFCLLEEALPYTLARGIPLK